MLNQSAHCLIWDAYRVSSGSVMGDVLERNMARQQRPRSGRAISSTNEGRRRNSDNAIVRGLEAGQVMAVLERLPASCHDLALYCYAPLSRERRDHLLELVAARLYEHVLMRGLRLPTTYRAFPPRSALDGLMAICAAATWHFAEATWPYRRSGLASARHVREWVARRYHHDLDVRCWSRGDRYSWSAVWHELADILEHWHGQALAAVGALIECEETPVPQRAAS